MEEEGKLNPSGYFIPTFDSLPGTAKNVSTQKKPILILASHL